MSIMAQWILMFFILGSELGVLIGFMIGYFCFDERPKKKSRMKKGGRGNAV